MLKLDKPQYLCMCHNLLVVTVRYLVMATDSSRPRATHEGSIKFPVVFQKDGQVGEDRIDILVTCANLDNGMRVLSESGFLEVMGRSPTAPGTAPGNAGENGFDKLHLVYTCRWWES
jgi:hypothetical protein